MYITQGDKGETGDQGPQGPIVCVFYSSTLVLILELVVNKYFILRCLSVPQGHPGEKGTTGSSDIIDFNGKLLDAFQVSDVKISGTRRGIVYLISSQESSKTCTVKNTSGYCLFETSKLNMSPFLSPRPSALSVFR